jgi:hypothetical protein
VLVVGTPERLWVHFDQSADDAGRRPAHDRQVQRQLTPFDLGTVVRVEPGHPRLDLHLGQYSVGEETALPVPRVEELDDRVEFGHVDGVLQRPVERRAVRFVVTFEGLVAVVLGRLLFVPVLGRGRLETAEDTPAHDDYFLLVCFVSSLMTLRKLVQRLLILLLKLMMMKTSTGLDNGAVVWTDYGLERARRW